MKTYCSSFTNYLYEIEVISSVYVCWTGLGFINKLNVRANDSVCVHITQSVFLILKTIAAAGKTNQHKIIAATVKAIQQGQSNKISNSVSCINKHEIEHKDT